MRKDLLWSSSRRVKSPLVRKNSSADFSILKHISFVLERFNKMSLGGASYQSIKANIKMPSCFKLLKNHFTRKPTLQQRIRFREEDRKDRVRAIERVHQMIELFWSLSFFIRFHFLLFVMLFTSWVNVWMAEQHHWKGWFRSDLIRLGNLRYWPVASVP